MTLDLSLGRAILEGTIAIGAILLAIDRWVHQQDVSSDDHDLRLKKIEAAIESYRRRSSEKQGEAQDEIGRVLLTLAEIKKDLEHAKWDRDQIRKSLEATDQDYRDLRRYFRNLNGERP